MEYDIERKEIYVKNKLINELDKFVIEFINILEKYSDYVIVSGYVSIALGRTRASEDVDLLIPEMDPDKFYQLFKKLEENNFECLNSYESKEAFKLWPEHAIRFSRKRMPLPNIEFKMITNEIQEEAFRDRIKLLLNNRILYVSPLELQIAYKLSIMSRGDFKEISSDKDFEDAKHIYEYFKEKLNKEKLSYYIQLFRIQEMWEWLQK